MRTLSLQELCSDTKTYTSSTLSNTHVHIMWHDDCFTVFTVHRQQKPGTLRPSPQLLVPFPAPSNACTCWNACVKDIWPPAMTSCSGICLFLLKFSFTDWRTNSQKVKVNRIWRERVIERLVIKRQQAAKSLRARSTLIHCSLKRKPVLVKKNV